MFSEGKNFKITLQLPYFPGYIAHLNISRIQCDESIVMKRISLSNLFDIHLYFEASFNISVILGNCNLLRKPLLARERDRSAPLPA